MVYRPKKKNGMPLGLIVFGSIIAICASGGIVASISGDKARTPLVVNRSPAMQQERKALIDKLIAEGVFYGITVPGTNPKVMVAPKFYLLKFDTKQSLASMIWCYYHDGSNQYASVNFYDGHSGKEVGSYSLRGLKLD